MLPHKTLSLIDAWGFTSHCRTEGSSSDVSNDACALKKIDVESRINGIDGESCWCMICPLKSRWNNNDTTAVVDKDVFYYVLR